MKINSATKRPPLVSHSWVSFFPPPEIESDLGDLGRYSKNEKKANVEYIIGVIFNLVLYNSLKNSIVPIHK